jgi:putative toxin-antitoxin system antitoxin component (TIGR02293 family)
MARSPHGTPETEPDFSVLPRVLMAHALDTFGDERKARSWLTTPNPVLDDREPFDLAQTPEGARRVEEILTRIDYGIFS